MYKWSNSLVTNNPIENCKTNHMTSLFTIEVFQLQMYMSTGRNYNSSKLYTKANLSGLQITIKYPLPIWHNKLSQVLENFLGGKLWK